MRLLQRRPQDWTPRTDLQSRQRLEMSAGAGRMRVDMGTCIFGVLVWVDVLMRWCWAAG
jgi:hypothetical protein